MEEVSEISYSQATKNLFPVSHKCMFKEYIKTCATTFYSFGLKVQLTYGITLRLHPAIHHTLHHPPLAVTSRKLLGIYFSSFA